MFSCLQILEAFLWFVLITLLNVTLIILTLSVSRLLNLLLRLVAFLLFLNPQCLASISRWITASSSWKRFCLFVCRASYMAVGFYVAKYVNKKSDMDLAAKGLGAKEWNNSLKTKLSLLPKKLFRIRMSRNFGMKMLTMT